MKLTQPQILFSSGLLFSATGGRPAPDWGRTAPARRRGLPRLEGAPQQGRRGQRRGAEAREQAGLERRAGGGETASGGCRQPAPGSWKRGRQARAEGSPGWGAGEAAREGRGAAAVTTRESLAMEERCVVYFCIPWILFPWAVVLHVLGHFLG